MHFDCICFHVLYYLKEDNGTVNDCVKTLIYAGPRRLQGVALVLKRLFSPAP